jgi:hypothetical protein
MPYAEDFETAAAAFDAAAQATGTLLDPARAVMASGVMVGGQLTNLVEDEIDAAGTMLEEITAELTRLAGLCRERAETSRVALAAQQDYESAYTAYERDLSSWHVRPRGPQPDPPDPPPPAPSWSHR